MTWRVRGWEGADIASAAMPEGQRVYVPRADARRAVLLAFCLGALLAGLVALVLVGGGQ